MIAPGLDRAEFFLVPVRVSRHHGQSPLRVSTSIRSVQRSLFSTRFLRGSPRDSRLFQAVGWTAGFARKLRRSAFIPTQEVSMQGSCSFQGLLIAENAG